MNRRRFLKTSLLAAAAPVALPALLWPLLASTPGKVLVLGAGRIGATEHARAAASLVAFGSSLAADAPPTRGLK